MGKDVNYLMAKKLSAPLEENGVTLGLDQADT